MEIKELTEEQYNEALAGMEKNEQEALNKLALLQCVETLYDGVCKDASSTSMDSEAVSKLLDRIKACIANGDNPRLKAGKYNKSAKELAYLMPKTRMERGLLVAALRPKSFFFKTLDIIQDTLKWLFDSIVSLFSSKQDAHFTGNKKEGKVSQEGVKEKSNGHKNTRGNRTVSASSTTQKTSSAQKNTIF